MSISYLSGTETDLDLAVDRYRVAKQVMAQAEQELQRCTNELVILLTSQGVKSHIFGDYRATLVQNETVQVDEKGLRKALGARMFNKLTTAKLDKKKLEKAVEQGEVDRVLVSQYSALKKSEPYIRQSVSKTDA